MPKFLEPLRKLLSRYGYSVVPGTGYPVTLQRFLVSAAKRLSRYGFETHP